jgi:hypothetical protein
MLRTAKRRDDRNVSGRHLDTLPTINRMVTHGSMTHVHTLVYYHDGALFKELITLMTEPKEAKSNGKRKLSHGSDNNDSDDDDHGGNMIQRDVAAILRTITLRLMRQSQQRRRQ